MTPAKKKSGKKQSAKKQGGTPKVGWADAMKQALQKKSSSRAGPDQPKPRDSTVQKARKNAF